MKISDRLPDKQQQVLLNGIKSCKLPFDSRVPKRTVFSHTLFLHLLIIYQNM